jgi:dihydroorotate dehydrogenase electron transfer subunit
VLLTVRSNRVLEEGYYLLDLDWPDGAGAPQAGQFVMVRTRETTDPLWRRPLGVHDFRAEKGSAAVLSLLYEVVGPTTRDLASLGPGATLDLLGPFGRGFSGAAGEHWMVAGGRGVAPLFYFARLVRGRGRACRLFIGGRSRRDVLRVEDFEALGCRVEVATDDGSRGHGGMVTQLLDRACEGLDDALRADLLLAACGPMGMLRAVAAIAGRRGVAAQVSIDPLMACGHGLCLGCSVRGREGYRLACQHGPVFRVEDLSW